MKQLKPETIETVKGYFLDGEINGEQYSQAEFEDIVTPFDLIHKPVYQIVESENYEESDVFGGYKSDRDLDKDRKHSEDFERLSREWIDNQEADFYAIVDDNESNELRIEFGGRNDSDPSKLMYPFSIMEGICKPNGGPYRERQKVGLRVARDYSTEVYEDAGVPSNFDNLDKIRSATDISDLEDGVMLNEIDLLTAFDRNNGVHDHIEKSPTDLSRLVRYDYRIIEGKTDTSYSRADSAVPYFFRWLPNDLESAGISMEEAKLAGQHIGTSNALGLSFRYDRAPEEIMTESVNSREHIVNIDPETVWYTSRGSSLDNDFHHFRQQFDEMAKPFWREKDIKMKQTRDDILDQTPEDMMMLVAQNLPKDWESEMPDEKFVKSKT